VVRIHAAGVNPVDWKTRAGHSRLRLPFVLGWDASGVVAALGEGVTRFAVGDEVFGMPWFPRQAGAYADYLTAPSRHLARKPTRLSFIEAAGLPLAGLVAWQSLIDTAELQAGQRVLIHAATGGVGHLAVQIAKARGAYVIGTARAEKHDFLRSVGADEAIDYTTTDVYSVVRDVDVALDLVVG
jgi:NADPH:quinone reductase-like Zn-dependent oxidoreductase